MNISLRDLALLADREKRAHIEAHAKWVQEGTEETYHAAVLALGRRSLAYELYIGVLFPRRAADEAVTG